MARAGPDAGFADGAVSIPLIPPIGPSATRRVNLFHEDGHSNGEVDAR